MTPFAHKVALVTGAARGIGLAAAKRFLADGWRVALLDIEGLLLESTVAALKQPDDTLALTCDVSDAAGVAAAIAAIANRFGRLDALVNNAGFSPKAEGGRRLGCLDGEMAVWQQTFAINFFAPVFFSRACAPLLAETGGSIVNITSIAGHRVHPFAGSAYSTSKAALTGLTRELAADLAHLGIRANAVCPGEINTAILSPGTESLVERIPLKRLGSPDEVAAVIFYLCSEQASYITGAEIPVNGGQDVY